MHQNNDHRGLAIALVDKRIVMVLRLKHSFAFMTFIAMDAFTNMKEMFNAKLASVDYKILVDLHGLGTDTSSESSFIMWNWEGLRD